MTTSELHTKTSQFVETLIPLAEAHPCKGKRTKLLAVMEGTLRKNVMRIQAIQLLHTAGSKLSGPALELTRNMVEDVVCIEYMLCANDPEQSAHRFFKFQWVQLKDDLEYYKLVGVDVDTVEMPDATAVIEREYLSVIEEFPDFLHKDGRRSRSWARRDVDMMLDSIRRKKVLSAEQIRAIARTYVNGSRKTHFNPVELLIYMKQDSWNEEDDASLKLSMVVSTASIIRLTTRYIDLINQINNQISNHRLSEMANTLLDEMNSAKEITL